MLMSSETTTQKDLPIPGHNGLPMHANSNPPGTLNMPPSDNNNITNNSNTTNNNNMSFRMPSVPQPDASALAYTFPNVMDMGQYRVPDASQGFFTGSHGESYSQSAGVSDMAASMTRFTTPMQQSTPDIGTQLQGSLSSFLVEVAVSGTKRNTGSNAFEPKIPAHIINKYSDDVVKAVEMTTLLASRGLTVTDGQVSVSINSPMEYAL
jgi:hypothetical protein